MAGNDSAVDGSEQSDDNDYSVETDAPVMQRLYEHLREVLDGKFKSHLYRANVRLIEAAGKVNELESHLVTDIDAGVNVFRVRVNEKTGTGDELKLILDKYDCEIIDAEPDGYSVMDLTIHVKGLPTGSLAGDNVCDLVDADTE